MHPLKQCSLRLQDPRIFEKYKESLYTSLAAHKVFQICKELHQASLQGIWTPTHEDSYHKLDETITRAMLHAENQLKKAYTVKLSWSPKLKVAVQAYRFWRLSKGQLFL